MESIETKKYIKASGFSTGIDMAINWAEQDMRVSRTELKKQHDRLKSMAEPLAYLSKKQMKKLPVSDYFLTELEDLADMTSANARNRQIKRIGKIISEEDRHSLVDALFKILFTPEQIAKIDGWYARLNIHDDGTLKQFVKQFKACEKNTLYQMLLWIEYAKHMADDELLEESEQDLQTYVHEMAILSR